MKPLEEKIFLNIGGLRYETYASTLQAFPGTKLCRLTEPQAAATFDYDPDTQEFFFDRSSCLFEDVLNYYRTKQLHCPDLTCKSALDEELAFWGLSNAPLAPCCWQKLTIAERQKEEYGIREEEQEVAGLLDQAGRNQGAWRGRWRTRIWAMFEKPFSSLSAKVLAAVCLLFNIGICCLFIAKAFEDTHFLPVYILENQTNPTSVLRTETHGFFYVKPLFLLRLELFCVLWFMLEFLLRLLSCPKKKEFLQSPLNVADFLCLFPVYIEFSLHGHPASHRRLLFWLDFLRASYFFKLLKVLKLVETPLMLRVLSYTSRALLREIITLLLLLLFEILFFGSLCYFVDVIEDNADTHFVDIGSAFWWALVTLTTVGYGDIVPISLVGRMFGACAALCGVLTIIIPIPFFCIKFQGYYDAVMVKEKRKRQTVPLPS
ncbi:potassium voltage-gated channel subfamily C member 1-like [Pseudonaja textilis]|uniref:potassium voltage-gated channel subfamily C member 1-like n=1 Tax=Pseudonaja textilis TaxID=8673 RepID=UPI000EA84C81|nr:potassium voltage-gated channel subfamily C member 1-like [Pseudonaja textilis]XP_026558879.1 potassium voltage-gated channel subfamily C member 1-like [Pseudonaja textilis]XP_026558880.1 potassium voltage-gated channel subfamily C member 1-like [Pseudonaja textilis]XP_026558881.1 potassium voltage-gated channel subfamily C member 1-like [Pseudonaja textilis]